MRKIIVPELLKLDIEMFSTSDQSYKDIHLYVEPEIWLAITLKNSHSSITDHNIKSGIDEWKKYYGKANVSNGDKFFSFYQIIFNNTEDVFFDETEIKNFLLSIKVRILAFLSILSSSFDILHLDELYMHNHGVEFNSFKLRQKNIALWYMNYVDGDSDELFRIKIKYLHQDLLYYMNKYATYRASDVENYKYNVGKNLENCLKIISQ